MRFGDYYTESEMLLPEGFKAADVESLEDFYKEEEQDGDLIDLKIKDDNKEEVEEDVDDAEISDVDIDAIKAQRMTGATKGDIAKRPEKMLHKSNIVDENGNLIDNEELMAKIMVRPTKLIDANSKLKSSGAKTNQKFYDMTLPAYQGLYVDEKSKTFKVVKTCPFAGECSKFCYAAKGGYVMFPASSMGSSRVVNYLMNDDQGFKKQMVDELNKASAGQKKRGNQVVLRWHDSGDFLSEKYLMLAYDIAKQTPDVLHYAYTKNIPLVRKMQAVQPENFVFNFSFGGAEDETIDVRNDKHARVVPANLFADIKVKGKTGADAFAGEALDTLKDRVAKEYDISRDSLISYDELLDTEYDANDKNKYNVLVWKGHGDDAATRKDVLGTYLLIH